MAYRNASIQSGFDPVREQYDAMGYWPGKGYLNA
jgi:hypothetical protein